MEGVKVKRDGPRGWHIISKDKYDPKIHELWEDEETKKPMRKGKRNGS